MRLLDKVIVITGGARGIGRAFALEMARAGGDIIIVDLMIKPAQEVADEIKSMGRESLAMEADISKSEDVKRMAGLVLRKFGRVDVLINNAGTTRVVKMVEMSEDEWDIVVNTNLKGTFLCSKAFIHSMVERKYGKIINISSVMGWVGACGYAQYCAAKAGIIGFTRALAMELAEYNINVNCIAPGVIATKGMLLRISEEEAKKQSQKAPMGRMGKPEDLLGALMLLATEDGSFITGETINVNGGWFMK